MIWVFLTGLLVGFIAGILFFAWVEVTEKELKKK